MFLHLSVSHSVHRGVVSQHALQVVSQHALQVSRPTPKGKVEGSVLGGGGLQTHTRGEWSPGPLLEGPQAIPPSQMATAADGTHPTGMHSC